MNCNLFSRSISMLLISGVLLVTILCFRNTDDPRVTKILNQIEAFTNRSNLQKIYLKTDKGKYITGETIWLKAYLLNAISLKPDIRSNEIYIDLIGRNNEVFQNIILRNTDGFANGDLILDDSIPEGNYQIVAYTNWMKNFDESYFFSKTIQIVNPNYNKFLTHASLSEIRKYNKGIIEGQKEKIVQFFPEGGSLVAGIPCRIAFKATNKIGYGVNVKGEIYDDAENRICHFESKYKGMGVINFTPELGKKYFAKATFDDDDAATKYDLPEVQTKGFVLLVNALAGDQIRINIRSNIGNQMDEKNNEFIIVGQSRGEVRYISKGVNKGKPINASIPKKYFPEGIAQITVFDGQGTPVCERLVFIHPKETERRTTVTLEKANEGNDILYKIQVKDTEGNPGKGNVALSLFENTDNNESSTWNENILSNLLLTSDLKGRVENANDYFNETNQEALINLDYVMMVNGWRRFVWKEILAGHFSPLIFAPSEGISPNEITTTSMKPIAINLSEKAYIAPLNEQYDVKLIRKNTRGTLKSSNAAGGEISSNTVKLNHNTATSYSDMIQYLKGRVAGVTVSDNGIIIRGINTFMAGTDPLILQDNSQIPFSTLRTISPNDVSSVEVLKGPDASLYGARGANGVLIIHMRTASEDWNNINKQAIEPTFERIISFYKAREFYVPAYDSWDKKPSEFNVPRSVFWKPNIAIDSTGQTVIRVKIRGDITNLKSSIEGLANDGSVLFYESID